MDDMIKYMNHSGMGIIGTPGTGPRADRQARDAVRRIRFDADHERRLGRPGRDEALVRVDRATGGPALQGQSQPLFDAAARAGQKRDGYNEAQHAAIAHMTKKYEDELAAKA